MIYLSGPAMRAIATEAWASVDGRETGGILLGHDRGASVQVALAGGPGPGAARSPDRFARDTAHAQRLADEAYTRDGSIWIGEWHTHPSGPPSPSAHDLATYTKLLADPGLGFARLVSIIVTACPHCGWRDMHMAGWIVSSSGMRPTPITVTHDEDADD